MNLFFTNLIQKDFAILTEAESKHAIQVLRLKAGDPLIFVDGLGGWYEGLIVEAHAKRCTIAIKSRKGEVGKRPYQLHLAIAPTKNIDRFEWILEKATELGIDRITPILCAHSERKVIKLDRLQRVIVSAMKQSLKAYIPTLDDLTPFEVVIRDQHADQKWMAHCLDQPRTSIHKLLKPGQNSLILIGPEGDFSQEEWVLAAENNFTGINLGPSRLRTETAAIAACTSVYLTNL